MNIAGSLLARRAGVNDPSSDSATGWPAIPGFTGKLEQYGSDGAMTRTVDDVKNWMNMFRWIVKLIRDEYGIDEKVLTRHAMLETDLGLAMEQVEQVLDLIAESFELRFPNGTLDEVLRLEELCLLASWLAGFYKRPEFISDGFEARCRATNARAAA